MKNKKQHYIPRFYLNKFLDPACSPRMEPYVWVFKNGATKSIMKAPRNIGYESHYYDLRLMDGTISKDVEYNFKKIEDLAAIIFKKIENGSVISNEDRLLFAEFVCTLKMRIPYHRDNLNMAMSDVSRMELKLLCEDSDCLRKILCDSDPKHQNLPDEEIAKIMALIRSDDYNIIIPKEYSILQMNKMAEELTRLVYNMKWSFLVAPNGMRFLTSDNPVVIVDPFNQSKFYGDGYLSSKSIELTFPLSPSVCLLATWGGLNVV